MGKPKSACPEPCPECRPFLHRVKGLIFHAAKLGSLGGIGTSIVVLLMQALGGRVSMAHVVATAAAGIVSLVAFDLMAGEVESL